MVVPTSRSRLNLSTPFTLNASADSNPPYVTEPFAVEVTRLTIESIFAFMGVVGNIIVALLVTRGRTLRSTSAILLYIKSLAIADLGLLMVNFPIAVMKEQDPLNWSMGKEMCYFMYPVSEVFHSASIWSIAAIAVERYRGVVHALHQSARWTLLIIALIWLGSFALFVVPLLLIVIYRHEAYGIFCLFNWPTPGAHKIYNMFNAFLLYLLPLVIITLTYVRISRRLNNSNALHKSLSSFPARQLQEMKTIKQNNRRKRLLTPLVIVFSVSMLPINVFRLVILFSENFTQDRLFLIYYNLSVIGVVINSAANPLIYSIATETFMAQLKGLTLSNTKSSRSGSSSCRSIRKRTYTDQQTGL